MEHGSDNKAVHSAVVTANRPLTDRPGNPNRLLELKLNRDFVAFPGQFIQIQVSELPDRILNSFSYPDGQPEVWTDVGAELRGKTPLLNRPFSIAAIDCVAGWPLVSVLYRIRGPGTVRLSELRTSYNIVLLGPLGRTGFVLPEGTQRVLLVAGGLGLAGLLFWARQLVERGVPVSLLAGSSTAGELPLPEPLWRPGVEPGELPDAFASLTAATVDLAVATDDGSAGEHGFVSALLERRLGNRPAAERWAIYACGPWPMLRTVARLARQHGMFCQVSLEEMMACGIGTCQACVIRVHADEPAGWRYKLCCTHGPVFEAETICWD